MNNLTQSLAEASTHLSAAMQKNAELVKIATRLNDELLTAADRAVRAEADRDIARVHAKANKETSDVWEAAARDEELRADAAEQREKGLREALAWYANRENYVSMDGQNDVWIDLGQYARAALAQPRGNEQPQLPPVVSPGSLPNSAEATGRTQSDDRASGNTKTPP